MNKKNTYIAIPDAKTYKKSNKIVLDYVLAVIVFMVLQSGMKLS